MPRQLIARLCLGFSLACSVTVWLHMDHSVTQLAWELLAVATLRTRGCSFYRWLECTSAHSSWPCRPRRPSAVPHAGGACGRDCYGLPGRPLIKDVVRRATLSGLRAAALFIEPGVPGCCWYGLGNCDDVVGLRKLDSPLPPYTSVFRANGVRARGSATIGDMMRLAGFPAGRWLCRGYWWPAAMRWRGGPPSSGPGRATEDHGRSVPGRFSVS